MNIVPAVNGLHWLRTGWQLFARNPLLWILTCGAQATASLLLMQIPIIGLPLAVLIMPAFNAGFLSMAETAENKRPLEPLLLFDGFRRKPGPLLGLGGAHLIAMALLVLLSHLLLGPPPAADAAPPPESGQVGALVFWLLLFALIHTGFWFAPGLALWQNMPPPKAIFFSFFAFWRNWRAMLFYFLALVLFISGALLLVSPLLGLFFGQQPAQAAMENFATAFIFGLRPMLLPSFYANYRDVFTPPTT